jgi:hypothetical protein
MNMSHPLPLAIVPLPAEEFAPFVKREVEKWAKVVVATGMTVE